MKSITRRAGTAVAVITAAALATSACASAATDGATSSGSDVDPDAVLRVGLVLEPSNLDLRKTAGAALEQILMDNVYQGLVSRTPEGEILPALASEWSVSDDGLTYSFTLNDGVTFHNGADFTASDVVASLTDVADDEVYAGHDELAAIDSVTATDDTQVTIALTEPNQNLLFSLAGPAGAIVDEGDETDTQTAANGTGPFVLQTWNEGDSIIFERNDAYWGEPAGVAEVAFSYIPDFAAGVNAALGGQLDVLTGVDPQLVAQFDGNDDWTVTRGKTTDKWILGFNNSAPELSDVRVREALRLAIDHNALVQTYGSGVTQFGPIPELDPGYEDLAEVAPYDPDKAKQLLADAGVSGLELTLTIPSVYGTTMSAFLTSAFNDIGVTLTVNPVEFPTWLNDVYTNADYQLSLVNHVEPRDFEAWANPDYYFRYDNAEVQSLYAQAMAETDESASAELLAQAARVVAENHASDWLLTGDAIVAHLSQVQGFPTDSTNSRLNLAGVTLVD